VPCLCWLQCIALLGFRSHHGSHHPPAAAGQTPRRAERELPDGVECVIGDLGDPAGLKAAFVGGQENNAIVSLHLTAERAVRESGLAWTFVRASGFMSNPLQWIPQLREGDAVREPFAEVPIAAAENDLAAVAAVALTSEGHASRAYAVTGPEAICPRDRVRGLAEILRRDLRLEPQSNEDAHAEMSKTAPVRRRVLGPRKVSDVPLDRPGRDSRSARRSARRPRRPVRRVRAPARCSADQ
jgi:uncharacterized protein YbjT (DUF2867 family)